MFELLYADRWLAVVQKPVGALSEEHPTAENVPKLLREALGDAGRYIGTIHRLDKNVGGLMVYALTPAVAAKLTQVLNEEGAGKEYLALLSGVPAENEGQLTDLLYHDKQRNKTFVVKRKRAGVKEAKLSYRVVREENGRALTSVKLHTGRTHQIRVQFASRGLPLVGDARYGGGKGDPMLYACRLTFRHPETGALMAFERMPGWGENFGNERICQ